MTKVRVRFAPSPTGALHIGGIRTALYNYLFAKKHGGTFILRIEDTDQGRFVPGAEEYIIEALNWVGLTPEEGPGFGGEFGPYRQSERKEIYHKYAHELVELGNAYYAFDTPESLEALRSAEANFTYNHTVREGLDNSLNKGMEYAEKRIAAGDAYVIRLKVTPGETVHIPDLVRGDVMVQSSELDDKVLLKADGMPTYHLANIVDDHLMEITHVIRGEEWLPSAAHHVLLYQSFGWTDTMPKFAHLPLILKPVGNGKLSKRDGAKFGMPVFPLDWKGQSEEEFFQGFREAGFIPDAVVNFLALLGWHPGDDQEIFTRKELISAFSVEHIGKSGARFDFEKAKWFNHKYIQDLGDAELMNFVKPLVQAKGYKVSDEYLQKALAMMKERVTFLSDFVEEAYYLFEPVRKYDEESIAKKWNTNLGPFFAGLKDILVTFEPFSSLSLEDMTKKMMLESGFKPGEILPMLRIALVGTMKGPAVFDTAELLGREETISRVDSFLQHVQAN
ncbi:MAG: glutamate--tRNA ligase [Saprospiraceae bacterium]